ncbi:hypothetical protein Fmac_018661 [Flemingia macrophylla]|uniref:Uncharacterized protein n=1 Tax=Flemingia macrophylla TaxID=520843 RepID=A0ABD1M5L6_9FABA
MKTQHHCHCACTTGQLFVLGPSTKARSACPACLLHCVAHVTCESPTNTTPASPTQTTPASPAHTRIACLAPSVVVEARGPSWCYTPSNPGKHIFDRFAVIFTIVIVWVYAHLLTVRGAYNDVAHKTQLSCRTDHAGLIDAAPWNLPRRHLVNVLWGLLQQDKSSISGLVLLFLTSIGQHILLSSVLIEVSDQGSVPTNETNSQVKIGVADSLQGDYLNEQGNISQTRLRVQDVFAMTDSPTKILTHWNRNNQPVGDSSSLLAGFLGQVASNFGNFLVLYENWAQEMANKNAANHAKLVIPHILGSKTLARKRNELELMHGREFSRAEMYQVSHKKADGTFVNEEARELHENLQDEMQNCSEDEAFLKVCGKEHSGYVRGMGLGVAEVDVLKSQIAFLMKRAKRDQGNRRSNRRNVKIATVYATVGLTVAILRRSTLRRFSNRHDVDFAAVTTVAKCAS